MGFMAHMISESKPFISRKQYSKSHFYYWKLVGGITRSRSVSVSYTITLVINYSNAAELTIHCCKVIIQHETHHKLWILHDFSSCLILILMIDKWNSKDFKCIRYIRFQMQTIDHKIVICHTSKKYKV